MKLYPLDAIDLHEADADVPPSLDDLDSFSRLDSFPGFTHSSSGNGAATAPVPVAAPPLDHFARAIEIHVELGTEDVARDIYGDARVDEWFRTQGWDPDAMRTEPTAVDSSSRPPHKGTPTMATGAREPELAGSNFTHHERSPRSRENGPGAMAA